jgi:diguanylate cyclase (GGDEF)-like protein
MRSFTRNQTDAFLETAKAFFDVARIVRPETFSDISQGGAKCFAVWDRNIPCSNCVSERALKEEKRLTKFEFIGKDIYYVVATPVLVDGEKVSLELVAKIDGDVAINSYGYNEFIDKISKYNDALTKDGMTGLYNKQYLVDHIEHMIASKSERRMGVIMCDIDEFKSINDKFGHLMGDRILSAVAKVLINHTAENEDMFSARFGGDEFVVLLHDANRQTINNLVTGIKHDIHVIDRDYPDFIVSLSVGTACETDGIEKADLLAEADRELYADKLKHHKTKFGVTPASRK